MQMANLAAFALLFPAAGKFKYASSVAHFLAQVDNDLQLQKILEIACSVNLTSEGHYFAFDEALEMYSVKFVKQNITSSSCHLYYLNIHHLKDPKPKGTRKLCV